jgi:peptide/nickel transport system permease protein
LPILLSSVFGLILGLLAGWHGGILSAIIMRTLDVIFAFPAVLLAVAIAAILGPGMANASLSMAIVLLPYVARIVYVDTIRVRGSTFIEAARVSGMRPSGIILREVVPNVLSPIIVYGTTALGGMVVFAAGLSFLGVGVQPPTADWGIMASDGRDVLLSAPWVSLIPGATIVIVAVALNFLGDGLRDALDPRLRTRR